MCPRLLAPAIIIKLWLQVHFAGSVCKLHTTSDCSPGSTVLRSHYNDAPALTVRGDTLLAASCQPVLLQLSSTVARHRER